MLTCKDCKDDVCPDMGKDCPGCDGFTSEAIEKEPAVWTPTPEDYNKLQGFYNTACNEKAQLEARLAGFEKAVAELVRWAQNGETP